MALQSLTYLFLLLYEEETHGLFAWGMGSLVQADVTPVAQLTPVVLLCIGGCMLLGHRMDILALGDDTAAVLGVRHLRALVSGEQCLVTASDTTFEWAPDQASNAAAITAIAVQRGMPPRAATIAIATAMQESKVRNVKFGDRDSLGLFQQRPSQGWGTPAQVTDSVLATKAFYGRAGHTNNTGLLDIDEWVTLPLAQAAQAVQRSAYPGAYAQWDRVAQDMADLLGPDLPTLPDTAGVAANGW